MNIDEIRERAEAYLEVYSLRDVSERTEALAAEWEMTHPGDHAADALELIDLVDRLKSQLRAARQLREAGK